MTGEGRAAGDLVVGESASLTRRVEPGDLAAFAAVTGDVNPAHLDAEWAARGPFGGVVAHGMLTAGVVSAVIGTRLPGPGTVYVSQSLRFRSPVRPGDEITATVIVREVDVRRNRAVLATEARCGDRLVLDGEAVVMPPRRPEGVA